MKTYYVAFTDMDNGLTTECLVADNPEGHQAKRFRVVQHVAITHTAEELS